MSAELNQTSAWVLALLFAAGCSSDQPVTPGSNGAGNQTTGNTATTSGPVTSDTQATSTSGTESTTSTGAVTTTTGGTVTTGTASVTTGDTSSVTSTSVGGATSTSTDTATSAGGTTTGAGGASSTTGADTGPSPDSIIIQDNFDAGTPGSPPDAALWEGYPQGQESLGPVVDSAKAKSGGNSARVQSTSSGLGSFLVPAAGSVLGGTATPSNAFYVRVHMNWAKATSEIMGHSAFIVGAASRDNSGTEARLGISSKGPGSVPRVDMNLQNPSDGAGGEVTRYSNGFTDGGNPADFMDVGYQFAADTWYCVEAYYDGTAGASEFRLWVDGAEVAEMHITDFSANDSGRTSWGPSYQYIKIGAQDYDANLGQIWYDDVVVATEPIGCDYVVP